MGLCLELLMRLLGVWEQESDGIVTGAADEATWTAGARIDMFNQCYTKIQGYREVYLAVTLKYTQGFVMVTFHSHANKTQ